MARRCGASAGAILAGLWNGKANGPGGSGRHGELLLLLEQVEVGGAAVAATIGLIKQALGHPAGGRVDLGVVAG